MPQQFAPEHYTMLCLGDSYTIGESVKQTERFPEQTVKLLKENQIFFETPQILARTGWSTRSLIDAIQQKNIQGTFDYVTLLTGVNDQFQEVDTNTYKSDFEKVLNSAIQYAAGKKDHVTVLSIPDYGVTPFAAREEKSPAIISSEIDHFNAMNKKIADIYGVHYIDINPISKKAKTDISLLANDGLHPSGKMYALWSQLLAAEILSVIQK